MDGYLTTHMEDQLRVYQHWNGGEIINKLSVNKQLLPVMGGNQTLTKVDNPPTHHICIKPRLNSPFAQERLL